MERLQNAGVAAGVCQNAPDRIERDPQLRHDQWMVPVTNTEVGEWPIRQFPIKLSETPTRPQGAVGRGHPNYAEDSDFVYGEILGMTESDRQALAEQNVI